jgi:hypothetical protein
MVKEGPTERLEKDNYKTERMHMKLPGKMYDTTKASYEDSADSDYEFIKKMLGSSGKKHYSEIHNHRYTKEIREDGKSSFPSDSDFGNFLFDDNVKTMEIYQQNPEEREIGGWYFIKKTSNTPTSGFKRTELTTDMEKLKELLQDNPFVKQIGEDIYDYRAKAFGIMRSAKKTPEERQAALNDIAQKYNLKVRFVPNKRRGYEYRSGVGFFKKQGLETSVDEASSSMIAATIAIVSLVLCLFFISINITGYTVNNLISKNSNQIGILFFILGLVSCFFYFKKK